MAPFDETAWRSLLAKAISLGASDLHLTAAAPVFLRVAGKLAPLPDAAWPPDDVARLLTQLLSPRQMERYRRHHEVDFAFDQEGRRFRVNVFRQRTGPALALRLIPDRIPRLDELGTPVALRAFLQEERGLILVTGRAGSGKTTSLAAYLGEVNRQRAAHIITLEDPIEFVHEVDKSLFSQRELGSDFASFAAALRSALREDPDILLIGELRDADTIRTALSAAETGHLVLGSLHTQTAMEAVLRLESFFPAELQPQIRYQLATVLRAIVSQRLLPRAGGGRICAAEILTASAAVRNLVRQGKVQQFPSVILAGGAQGMRTMEQAVRELFEAGKIAGEVARQYSS